MNCITIIPQYSGSTINQKYHEDFLEQWEKSGAKTKNVVVFYSLYVINVGHFLIIIPLRLRNEQYHSRGGILVMNLNRI